VIKRNGYERFDAALSTVITHLQSWRDSAARSWLVAIDEAGQIRHSQDSSQTFNDSGQNIGNGGSAIRHPVGRAVANGSLYITSRRGHNTLKWTGSAWSSLTTVPKAQFAEWRFEQLFLANIAGAPSQLRISIELNPEDFTTEPATIDIESDDGTEIRGLAPSGDDLLIFKDHAIHIFSGKTRSDFQKYRLDSLRGTYSPRTIKQVRGLLIFFDRDTGVWAWDGSQFTLISEKINQYLLDNITYDYAWVAAGYVRRDQYVLSVPWQGGTVNQRSFVYSTLTNSWTEWDFGGYDAEAHLNHTYIAGPRNAVGVYRTDTGHLDNGTPIECRFRTSWMLPGGPGSLARLRRLETSMKASGADLSVTLYHDYDMGQALVTRNFSADDPNRVAEFDLIKNLDGWGGRADAHQLEFVNNDDKELQINAMNAIFTVNRDTLGEHV
jgi:hypothetical protein